MKSFLFTAFFFFISTQPISWAQKITAEFAVSPGTIEVGTSTIAQCTVSGLVNHDAYTVRFFMKQEFTPPGQTGKILGAWEVGNVTKEEPTFVSQNNPKLTGVIAEAGNNGTYPTFSINLQLINIAAQGTYWCQLYTIIPNSPNSANYAISNGIQTSSAANVASLVVPQYNFTVGSPFPATCTIVGSSILLAYTYNVRIYYLAHRRIDTKLIGQFTIEDLQIDFTADDTVSQVSTSAGNVARPYVFEFLVTPKNETAVGTYVCSVETKTSQDDPTAREYFSNDVVMSVLDAPCPHLPSSKAFEMTILSFCMLFGGLLIAQL